MKKLHVVSAAVLGVGFLYFGSYPVRAVIKNWTTPSDSQSQVIDLQQMNLEKNVNGSSLVLIGTVIDQKYAETHLGRPLVITDSTGVKRKAKCPSSCIY